MKFKIEKGPFLKILQRSQGIVEKRNSMPILSNVLLEATSGVINTIATDLEIFIKDSCCAKIEKEGSITVNSKKFFEIIKELPEEEIDISISEAEKVTVKSGKAKFKIPGLNATEFPAFPTYEEKNIQKIETEILKEMIEKTLFATSTDENRYNINGVLFEKSEDSIKMIATDGHRLAMVEKKGEKDFPGPGEKGVILPRKGVLEIKKLIDEKDGDIELAFSDKNVIIKKGATLMNIRLIEGEFPDYRQVIPENMDNTFIVDRMAFLSSLKRVSILSSDKIKGVKFVLSRKKLILNSSTPENGDATEEVAVDYDGEEMEIAFNAKYFIEALETLNDAQVKVELKEQLNPGLLKTVEKEGFYYVVMPMRL